MDVVKFIGKYLNTPIGTVCYNTDKVLTTVLDKENIEGFACIILKLAQKSGKTMNKQEILLCYQWLEHLAMYSNQAVMNPTFAKNFLQGFNSTLEKTTYLTGNHLTITDIAAYHVLYPLIERLTVLEQESLIHTTKSIPNSVPLWDQEPLPKQIYPHELKNVSLDEPVLYFPQPFSFPRYPIVLYLKK